MEHLGLTLDSLISRNKIAKSWAERFGVDHNEALKKLNSICASAVNKAIERKNRHEEKINNAERVSVLADRFMVEVVKPEWHRNGKTVFSKKAGREIPLLLLWQLATDPWTDAVNETLEGCEGVAELNFRQRLSVLRDAIVMAASRAIKTLPEWSDVAEDKTVKPETQRESLLDELVAWLLIERKFTDDNSGVITTSIYQWAFIREPDDGWQQCHALAVWGRRDAGTEQPRIAVKGAILRKDLRAESTKKLAAGLREHGLARIDEVIKVEGKPWRVWTLTQKAMDAVTTADTGVTA